MNINDMTINEAIKHLEKEIARLQNVLQVFKSFSEIKDSILTGIETPNKINLFPTSRKSAIEIAKDILSESTTPIHGNELHRLVLERGGNIKKASLVVALTRCEDIEKTAPNTWKLKMKRVKQG